MNSKIFIFPRRIVYSMKQKVVFLIKNLKIRDKTMAAIFLAVLVSNSIFFGITYLYSENSIINQAKHNNTKVIATVTKDIDQYFMELESSALSIVLSPIIQDALISHPIRTSYERYRDKNNIENSLRVLKFSQDGTEVALFARNGRLNFFTHASETINHSFLFQESSIYEMLQAHETYKALVLNQSQDYLLERYRYDNHAIIYKVNNAFAADCMDYLLIEMKKEKLKKLINRENINSEYSLVVDENKNLVYSEIGDSKLLDEIIGTLNFDQESGYYNTTFNNKKHLMVYGKSQYTNWMVVNIASYSNLLKDVSKIKLLYALSLGVIFIIALIVSYYFSLLITRPVEQVIASMERAKKGNLLIQVDVDTFDEMGRLAKHFNEMMSTIHELVRKNESISLINKEKELKSLQQQINPHFLYNTLEIIIGLAVEPSEYNNKNIIGICKNLGSMFRYSLSKKRIITIEEELNQIKSYITILQRRYEDKFDVIYDIDNELLPFKTEKFILQPFVENAMHHGFKDAVSGGLLKISIKGNKDSIVFTLSDNGTGISDETLNNITDQINSFDQQGLDAVDLNNHIGIMNVYLRLKLLYGEKVNLNIVSSVNNGTTIKITIPKLLS